MPPKEQRQPEVKQDPVEKAHEPEPAWVAALFERMGIVDDKVTKLTPRIDAIEDKLARDDLSGDESDHRSNRGRSKGKSRQRRRSRSESSSRDRRRGRNRSRHRRDRSYDGDDTYKDRRPRFRTDSLTAVRYGDDVATWLVEMDHIVLKHGEEVVCPEIFGHCFQSGDAIKLWFMGLDPDIREHYTSGSGCWKRFRSVMERRFTADVATRQLAAEDRSRLTSETYAEFAIKKLALIKTSFAHLEEAAMIAMVKRKLDFEAAQFCREKSSVEGFVSELIEYDSLRAMQTARYPPQKPSQRAYGQPYVYGQPTPATPTYTPSARDYGQPRRQASQYQPQPASAPPAATVNNSAYADPRLPTVQPRKHPQTGIDTLSYLDRAGKTVFIQRPCGHCESAGVKNAWHFDFACSTKPPGLRRARTYAISDLPGTFESPSGLPTSYTFSGHAIDPDPEENPFSLDDVYGESGNVEGDQ
jgi:hypothetical protein